MYTKFEMQCQKTPLFQTVLYRGAGKESSMKEFNHLLSGHFEQDALQEFNQMLDKETAKPLKKQNPEEIEEITNAYLALSGREQEIRQSAEKGIQKLLDKPLKKSVLRRRNHIRLWTAACIAGAVLILNAITAAAFDMDAFSFVVHIVDDGFSVDFFSPKVPQEDVIQLPTTEDDPYGIIAECEKNGLYPETPHYLPEGYVLTLCKYSDMPKFCQGMKFTFKNQNNVNESICFMYHLYENEEYMTNAKFSNVEHNLREIEVNGKTAILAEEKKDKQFTIVYHIDNLLISIFTENMPDDEVYKIIESIY